MTLIADHERWSTPDWLDQVTSWIDERLAAHGIERTEPLGEQRIRSWATTISIMTSTGRVWFKAASPVTAHEANIYPLLARTAPDVALSPLGIDTNRAWMLLPDGGTSMLHALSGDALPPALEHLLPRYARMQITLADHADDLLAAGVEDMRPQAMPGRFDAALAACARFVPDDETRIFEEVRAVRPRYVAWCERLEASAIRPSLDHSDLHTNNILLADPGDLSTARVYDWGDSVLAHPFSSLLVLLRQVSDRIGPAERDATLARIRDAYLRPFGELAPGEDLAATADLACRVAIVMRATIWLRVLELGPPPDPAYATAPWEWMKTLLQESWLE